MQSSSTHPAPHSHHRQSPHLCSQAVGATDSVPARCGLSVPHMRPTVLPSFADSHFLFAGTGFSPVQWLSKPSSIAPSRADSLSPQPPCWQCAPSRQSDAVPPQSHPAVLVHGKNAPPHSSALLSLSRLSTEKPPSASASLPPSGLRFCQ